MYRTFWITPISILFLATAVFVAQSTRNRRLQELLSEERHQLVALRENETLLPSNRKQGNGRSNRATAEDEKDSAERIKRALSDIDILVRDVGDMEQSPASFFEVLPDLLRVVQHLTTEEIIKVAKGIELPASEGIEDGKGAARLLLLLLSSEDDPERLLADDTLIRDRELRQSLMRSLARRDPDRALQWLEKSDMSTSKRNRFESQLIAQILLSDIDVGLKLLREKPGLARETSGRFSTAPIPEEMLPELVEASRKPENAAIKTDIVNLVLSSASAEGGIPAARALAERFQIYPKELLDFFGQSRSYPEPEALLTWMMDVLPAEDQLNTVPKATQLWASRDFNAAGKWLGNMETSAVKDESLRRYSNTVVNVDPHAAMLWAAEIQDDDIRRKAIESAAIQWKSNDAAAANQWLKDNGIELSTE